MKTKNFLRLAILIELILLILAIMFSYSLEERLPIQLQNYIEWESNRPLSASESFILWFALIIILINFLSSVFLFFIKNRAKWFYIISTIILNMLTISDGPTVEHALVSTLDLFSVTLSGVIIGIICFTDVFPPQKTKKSSIKLSKIKKPAKSFGISFLVILMVFVAVFVKKNSPPLNIERYLRDNMHNSNHLEGYECTVPNWFSEVWIYFDDKSGETFTETFERGYTKVKWTYSELEKVKAYACNILLPLKNDSWLEDYEAPVSNRQFISRIKISSVSVDEDDSIEINFYDDNLFFGHLIFVRVDASLNIYDAGIQG